MPPKGALDEEAGARGWRISFVEINTGAKGAIGRREEVSIDVLSVPRTDVPVFAAGDDSGAVGRCGGDASITDDQRAGDVEHDVAGDFSHIDFDGREGVGACQRHCGCTAAQNQFPHEYPLNRIASERFRPGRWYLYI